MSVELSLLPLEADYISYDDVTSGYSHSILNCGSSWDLYDKLRTLLDKEGTDVPERFSTFMGQVNQDYGYNDTHEDAYASPLRCLTAAQLLKFKNSREVKNGELKRPAWAYLDALPPSSRIALFFH